MHVGQVLDFRISQISYRDLTSHSSSSSANDVISFSNGRGTCYGDSGGPAIVKQPDGSYVQVFYFILAELLILVFGQVFLINIFRLEFCPSEHWLDARRGILVDRFLSHL